MSMVVQDALGKAVKKVAKLKEPDWRASQLAGGTWDKVSSIVVAALDEMKGHGVGKPLVALQELAFREALKTDAAKTKASRPLHTVALWLTDTSYWVEQFVATKDAAIKVLLEERGLIKPQKAGA